MNDELNEILKESNLQVLNDKLDLFIHSEEYSEENNILNFIEKTYLPNLRIKTKVECENCKDSNEALLIKYTIEEKELFLKNWIAEGREIMKNRFPKTKPINKRRESKEKDITNKGLEVLKNKITPYFFVNLVNENRKDLSEIDFAKECLILKEIQIENETQYNNLNAVIYYKYYRDIIKEYLTSKGWKDSKTPPPAKETSIMKNIKISKALFNHIIKLFLEFNRKEERPRSFIISADGIDSLNIENLIDELGQSHFDTRLNIMFEMSKQILDQWNKEIYHLKSSDEIRCLSISKKYTVGEKTVGVEYTEWAKYFPSPKRYSIDELIEYVNDFNGYCKKEFDLETLPKEEDTLSKWITHDNSEHIIKEIKRKFKGEKGVRLRILFEALQKLDLFPNNNASLFHKCCKNDFNWKIGSLQAMGSKSFSKRGDNSKDAEKTEHEVIFDETITFLKKTANIE